MEINDSLTSIDDAVEREPARVSDIGSLFFQPTRFFRTRNLNVTPLYLIVAWLIGIGGAISRVDSLALRSDLGSPRPGFELIADSWLGYWTVVLLAGSIGAVFVWLIRGWWYRVRINWSGDKDADKKEARLVFVFAGIIVAATTILDSVFATFTYENYAAYWNSDSIFAIVLLVFPFWSVVISYKGVRERFDVIVWRARLWFLILPFILYIVGFGVLTILLIYLGVYEPTYAT